MGRTVKTISFTSSKCGIGKYRVDENSELCISTAFYMKLANGQECKMIFAKTCAVPRHHILAPINETGE